MRCAAIKSSHTAPYPPPALCPPANPPRNCSGKQLGFKWADAHGGDSSMQLALRCVSGYNACCEECLIDYGCKRFMGTARSCTMLYDAANATLAKAPSKSCVGVMQVV